MLRFLNKTFSIIYQSIFFRSCAWMETACPVYLQSPSRVQRLSETFTCRIIWSVSLHFIKVMCVVVRWLPISEYWLFRVISKPSVTGYYQVRKWYLRSAVWTLAALKILSFLVDSIPATFYRDLHQIQILDTIMAFNVASIFSIIICLSSETGDMATEENLYRLLMISLTLFIRLIK